LLKQRVITAILLLALIVPAIFIPNPWLWPLLSLAFCAAACWEWARMVSSNNTAIRSAILLLLAGLCVLTLSAQQQQLVSLVFATIAAIFWLLVSPFRLKALDARPHFRRLDCACSSTSH
jgi:phosphatidate cytidylyltransferase